MEKISIVLPCYNHAEYVGDSIRSVLNQTYENFELFVFDNGSTDNSWEVINTFDDPRMVKIRLEKNDMLEVKKRFIEMATATYFAIMYSDDVWMKTKLEKQMELMGRSEDIKVCFTWSRLVNEELDELEEEDITFHEKNKSQKEWWNAFFTRTNHLSVPSFLAHRDIYIKYFGKLYPYRQIADYYCWMKILQETNLYIVEEELVKQRWHPSGNTPNESARSKENLRREIIELKYVIYNIINEMPDEVFIECFCDGENNQKYSHIDVMCKKFLYMKERKRGYSEEYDNAIRYYDSHFDYQEDGVVFYQLLSEKYGFSRNDFFEYTSVRDDVYSIIESRCNRWGLLEVTDFSAIDYPEKVSIYGAGMIGRAFYKRIKDYCQVEQFIDIQPYGRSFEKIPLRTISDAIVSANTVIIVTPTYDFDKIMEGIREIHPYIPKENIIRFEDFVGVEE